MKKKKQNETNIKHGKITIIISSNRVSASVNGFDGADSHAADKNKHTDSQRTN